MKHSIVAASVLCASILFVGCGAPTANNTANNTAGGNQTTGATQKNFKVGLITDIGGINDHSFNYLAYQGLQNAQKKLGIKGTLVQSSSASDYIPNLTKFAQQGYNLVIAVGFLMTDAVEQVSAKFPNTKFLIIDVAVTDRKNVTGAVFKTEQSAYLAGAMAGLMEQKSGIANMNSQNVVGVVGGMQIPPVMEYIAGFQQGFKKTDPNGTLLLKWTNSFSDQTLGYSVAKNEISSGADIVYQLCGGAGLGVINAAKDSGVYAIGADADQSYLAPSVILTSTLKGVDVATFDIIQKTMNNQFQSGVQYFDLKDNGVGLSKPLPVVPSDIMTKVTSFQNQIENGQIKVSPNMAK